MASRMDYIETTGQQYTFAVYNNSAMSTNLDIVSQEHFLWCYHLTSMIILFGFLGNILALLVLLRKRFRHLSTIVYLLLLVCSDMMFLLLKLAENISHLTGSEFLEGSWVCRFHRFLDLTLGCISSWTIVHVTLERLLYACLPINNSAMFCKQRNSIIVCVILIALSSGTSIGFVVPLNKHCFLTYSRIEIGLAMLVVRTLLPCALILVFSLLLAYFLLYRKRTIVRRHQQVSSARLTGLITVNIMVFLALILPLQVFSVLLLSTHISWIYVLRRIPSISIMLFMMATANRAINPYLYALSGSLYRQELKLLLRLKGRRNFIVRSRFSVFSRETELCTISRAGTEQLQASSLGSATNMSESRETL